MILVYGIDIQFRLSGFYGNSKKETLNMIFHIDFIDTMKNNHGEQKHLPQK